MDRNTENEIALFFQKRVRERISYLMTSKKRGDIFQKLAHTAEEYLDSTLIVEKSNFPIEREIIEKRLGNRVYVMKQHSVFDGDYSDIGTALDELWSCGVPYLLYGNGCLYVETEYDFSEHAAYILKRNDKL